MEADSLAESARHRTHQSYGGDVPIVDDTLAALAAELQTRLDAGALVGLGPVTLKAGPFADAELARKVLLADLDHLSTLAEHTGRPAGPDRWVRLADDVRLLLLMPGLRRDRSLNGRNGASAPAP